MNLYRLHNQSTQLTGFTAATESIPEIAWKHFENDPQELRRLEHLWAHDPKLAYSYTHKVLGKSWPEGEPAIARDPEWSYGYARHVLDKPFPAGEPQIAQYPRWAYWYARNVLKKPWPLAEPAIVEDPEYWKAYLRAFPERRPVTKTENQS